MSEKKIENTKVISVFTLKKSLLVVKLIFTFIIAYYIYNILDFKKLFYTIQNSNKSLIIAAILLLVPNLFMQYKKWHYLVDKVKEGKQSRVETLGSVFIGITFGIVTPGKVGELGKLFFISDIDRIKLLGYSIFEKIYDLIPVTIFGLISLPFLPHTFFNNFIFDRVYAFILFLFISFVIIFIALNPSILRVLLNYINEKFLKKKISKVIYSINHLERTDAINLLKYSTVLNLIFSTQFVLLVVGLSNDYLAKGSTIFNSTIEFLILYPASWVAFLIKTLLPFSVGDIGIREGASKIVFGLYNIDKESAISAAFLLFVINILFPSLIGLLLIPFLRILKERRSRRRAK